MVHFCIIQKTFSSYLVDILWMSSTKYFSILEPQNPLITVFDLHKIRGSAVFESFELRNVSSEFTGSMK